MILEKNGLKIRTAIESDAEKLFTWWTDGKVMKHAGFPLGLKTSVDEILKTINSRSEKNTLLIIEFNNESIGEMNYRAVSDKIVEIGIKICDFTKHDKGLGSKSLKLLIDYLFKTKNFLKIILDTNLNNKRAQHVYEKLGFSRVRICRNAWENQIGELQSSVEYELNKADW